MAARGIRGGWLVVAALAMTCTHPGELARVGGGAAARSATDAGLPVDVSRSATAAAWAGQCPVAVENAGVEVARVAGVGLTVCDVAVRAWHRTRVGLPALGVRALVDELVAEEGAAALAREETGAGGLRDRAVAATLAEGLLRAEALARVTVPDEAAMARWYSAHSDDFQRPARVRARWAILRTERAARAAIAALAAGETDFEAVLAQSIDPLRARDHGDLGELRREEVPSAVGGGVVEAAFALGSDGAVAERPVRVSVTTMVTVRRRQRARRVAGWAVVQRIGRREAEVLPLEAVRRRVQHRMMRERYESAREAAGARWEERLRPQVEAAIDARALGTVRVTPRE
nr:peptidyl-prolyl cis-trans isomerase [Deltaproteobacteria bacterium]